MASTTTNGNIDEERPNVASSESDTMTRKPEDSGKEKEKEEETEGPRFRDLGGMEKVLEELKEVLVPLYTPELPRCLGVRPVQGILLHGSPGCGKTKLALAIAKETNRPLHKISAFDIVSTSIDESEKKIRELFSEANKTAPSIILIDDIHAIDSESEYLNEVTNRRIVTQLTICMDASQGTGHVLVIGATNLPDDVDPALKRPGRFDREIFIGDPDEIARADILSKLTRNKKFEGSFDIIKIAKSTPGFVGADLDALVNKAGNLAIARIISERKSELLRDSVNEEEWWKQKWSPEKLEKLEIVMADFEEAFKLVQPLSRREGFNSMSHGETPEDSEKEKEKEKEKEEERERPRFRDLVGMEKVLEELKEVLVPLYNPELVRCFGAQPMQGILLNGPPECDKVKLAQAIANETGGTFHKISARDIVSASIGELEQKIQKNFSEANITAPSIILIDEIHAIAPKRENLQNVNNRRFVTQLITCMDASQKTGHVFVIGATNRPNDVDPALRKPGRLGREIVIGDPNESARADILSKLISKKKFKGSFDMLKIAKSTPGFVGADLDALVNNVGNLAINRIISERKSELLRDSVNEEEWWKQKWLPEEMEKHEIIMADFEEAIKLVQPSSSKEGLSSIPNVKWEDVGGLDFLRKDFDRYIIRRIKFPKLYEGFGMDLETGFLLYGPPGCGKTLIAKVVASEAGANFIHIKGPELLNMYVGESERAVRTLFSRARKCSPCILFFDEVDALTKKRGYEGARCIEGVLNQLLVELDGGDQRRGVYVIGATNRPEVMDKALLRPGRLGKLVYVPLPSSNERGLILKSLGRKKPIDATVDLTAIGRMEKCNYFSGADLNALMNEAAMVALEEKLTAETNSPEVLVLDSKITTPHFLKALSKVSPSVSKKEQGTHRTTGSTTPPTMQKEYYENLSETFKDA